MKQGFVIHHNGPPAGCVGQSHARCERFWQAVRDYHVNTKGWSDIAYSFGVCPHGVRFTGRGWFKNQFANGADQVGPNDGGDSTWFTVLVFLGGDEKPTAAMVDGVKALIVEGRNGGRCGQRVLPHNAFKVKACPGPEFTALAAVWNDNPTLGGSAGEWDEMASKDEIKAAVRDVLNEGTATGQVSWAGTSKATLAAVQTTFNAVTQARNAVLTAVREIAVESGVAAPTADQIVDRLKERL